MFLAEPKLKEGVGCKEEPEPTSPGGPVTCDAAEELVGPREPGGADEVAQHRGPRATQAPQL